MRGPSGAGRAGPGLQGGTGEGRGAADLQHRKSHPHRPAHSADVNQPLKVALRGDRGAQPARPRWRHCRRGAGGSGSAAKAAGAGHRRPRIALPLRAPPRRDTPRWRRGSPSLPLTKEKKKRPKNPNPGGECIELCKALCGTLELR